MTAEAIAAVALSWMLRELPPEKVAPLPTYPEAQESVLERTARYHDIAADLADVIEEEVDEPQRRYMAALLMAVAIRESGLAKDVDAPRCGATRIKAKGCDGGRARSIMQIQGHTILDRRDAFRTGLKLVRRSFAACRHLPQEARLAGYAAGVCFSEAGQRLSRDRFALARKLLASNGGN